MARKREAGELLRNGLSPSEIAEHMGISVKSVIQYLCTLVGEGSLRLSDVYFSWPPEKREIFQQAGRSKYWDDRLLSLIGLCREELELFESLRGRRVFSGDMYEYISEAEVAIHGLVQTILERELGTEESGWWREGIPSSIRVKCASRREEDDEPCEAPYAYTTLIDLSTVISKNWTLFQGVVPSEYAANRKQLESDLIRLNRIRNAVMHPVKERKWTEDDFEFVRQISTRFKAVSTV
jgi:hypothetical protein